MNLRTPLLGLVLTAFCLALLFTLLPQETPPPARIISKTVFMQDRAYSLVDSLATGFPRRDDLGTERRAAQEWLAVQFGQLGITPQVQPFSEHIGKRKVSGLANVYAVIPGTARPEDVLLVLAHYDIPPFVRQGAADLLMAAAYGLFTPLAVLGFLAGAALYLAAAAVAWPREIPH